MAATPMNRRLTWMFPLRDAGILSSTSAAGPEASEHQSKSSPHSLFEAKWLRQNDTLFNLLSALHHWVN